ncbi:pantoate--beta-alanine ligase [Flavipsychrobacter stenotrophus]|uniref:Pantothenate synthetase n=1 Tax=Flavipsychrobacter stenotrophus TaxID=2077091 RepID=A0A2S7SXS1_9BACT|nr:pantoate--beta-alanine ligase [Flavipsychrobacter stenotrophus]PQJ11326.1 pantoate--beta-alanine ligase [Flavipsychrobacter stenotrophus]
MVIFKEAAQLGDFLRHKVENNLNIGFIPTMGALHSGHISLVKNAHAQGMFTVCSIFLNPTQFNDKKDYEQYPVSTDADIEMLLQAGCDVLFLPSVEEMYPGGTDKMKTYDFGYLDTILEGANRPGHFKGVGQIVSRLLDIVKPHTLYLGQKDYQQCMVIKKLIEILGLPSLNLVISPTLREQDGLAMSSRNRRLTEPQRALAALLYQCLVSIQTKQAGGNFAIVQKECTDLLIAKGFTPEYVALADANNLQLLSNYDNSVPMITLIAAKIGEIRLIDNILLQ